MLRPAERQFILLRDDQRNFELVPYHKVSRLASGSRDAFAFTFDHKRALYTGSCQFPSKNGSGSPSNQRTSPFWKILAGSSPPPPPKAATRPSSLFADAAI